MPCLCLFTLLNPGARAACAQLPHVIKPLLWGPSRALGARARRGWRGWLLPQGGSAVEAQASMGGGHPRLFPDARSGSHTIWLYM